MLLKEYLVGLNNTDFFEVISKVFGMYCLNPLVIL